MKRSVLERVMIALAVAICVLLILAIPHFTHDTIAYSY